MSNFSNVKTAFDFGLSALIDYFTPSSGQLVRGGAKFRLKGRQPVAASARPTAPIPFTYDQKTWAGSHNRYQYQYPTVNKTLFEGHSRHPKFFLPDRPQLTSVYTPYRVGDKPLTRSSGGRELNLMPPRRSAPDVVPEKLPYINFTDREAPQNFFPWSPLWMDQQTTQSWRREDEYKGKPRNWGNLVPGNFKSGSVKTANVLNQLAQYLQTPQGARVLQGGVGGLGISGLLGLLFGGDFKSSILGALLGAGGLAGLLGGGGAGTAIGGALLGGAEDIQPPEGTLRAPLDKLNPQAAGPGALAQIAQFPGLMGEGGPGASNPNGARAPGPGVTRLNMPLPTINRAPTF